MSEVKTAAADPHASAKEMVTDVFVRGARQGWGIAIGSMLPNVLMAFVIIKALQITGLLKLIGIACGPVMAVFGLPGEAAPVLLAAWMSMGGFVRSGCDRRHAFGDFDPCDLPHGLSAAVHGASLGRRRHPRQDDSPHDGLIHCGSLRCHDYHARSRSLISRLNKNARKLLEGSRRTRQPRLRYG